MSREKFLEHCRALSGFFGYLNDNDEESGKDPIISRFIGGEDFYDRVRSVIGQDDENYEKVCEMIWNSRDIAFSIGFVLGSEIEVTNLELRANVEAIRKEIKEKGLLPYLPREKKAA